MGKYRIILWDVDQTLLDFKRSESFAVRNCFKLFGLEVTDEIISQYSIINESFWKRIERKEIEKGAALIGRFETLFETLGIKGIDPVSFQKEYADLLGSVYYFQDHSYELLQSLQNKYRQFIVTNGVAATQLKKLSLSGIDKLVEHIFVSEQMGAEKPQKEFFDACFRQIPNGKREEMIIVGDSLSSDILGGNQSGIDSCWYNPKGISNTSQAKPDYEIFHLNQIKILLEG